MVLGSDSELLLSMLQTFGSTFINLDVAGAAHQDQPIQMKIFTVWSSLDAPYEVRYVVPCGASCDRRGVRRYPTVDIVPPSRLRYAPVMNIIHDADDTDNVDRMDVAMSRKQRPPPPSTSET